MEAPKYQRVLLKLSGEALAGDARRGLDFDVIHNVCVAIKECVDMGVQVGLVIGGGNFWRGVKNGEGYIERTRADHMGMLATTINSLALQDALEQNKIQRESITEIMRIQNNQSVSDARLKAEWALDDMIEDHDWEREDLERRRNWGIEDEERERECKND